MPAPKRRYDRTGNLAKLEPSANLHSYSGRPRDHRYLRLLRALAYAEAERDRLERRIDAMEDDATLARLVAEGIDVREVPK